MTIRTITETSALAALCDDLRASPYVTVDTEFMRERTYWPVLCLVQVARPQRDGETADDWERDGAAVIDPLVEGFDLAPLAELLADPSVVKVFHAARQDVEIFQHLFGSVPVPLYDTQVAAMVCGYGDQVGYETLVRSILGRGLDKSSRFTDWARRPLTDKQLSYALADVTHLRTVYESLRARIADSGRADWVTSEMAVLEDPSTYVTLPEDAWRRLKMRNPNAKVFAAARALAAWREAEAQRRDIPRNRVMKDDAILELAATRPSSIEGLQKSRLLTREHRGGAGAEALLAALSSSAAVAVSDDMPPRPPEPVRPDATQSAVAELLRTLLRAKSAETEVAAKLIASAADLDRLAVEDAPQDLPALIGWRREVFGEDALRLKRGEIALSAGPEGVKVVPVAAG